MRYSLKADLGSKYEANGDDVWLTKRRLEEVGYYDLPAYGATPYPDAHLFKAITRFQQENGLKADGVMRPGGETEAALLEPLDPGLIYRC